MENCSGTCVFRWYVHNPFLPSETKEATFSFRSPKVTQWQAFLERGQGRRAVNNWPVSFSLQYFPPDEGDALEVRVSVNFVEVGNEIPNQVYVFFNRKNSYRYTYNSSIRPDHGELEIIVEIIIPSRYKEVFEFAKNDLEDLSNDLKRLRSERPDFDLWLQSKDPGTRFPVHSYILNARWYNFYRELVVMPNTEEQPTAETDILPDVLDDILTYLYTGTREHFHLRDPRFEEYRTELFQTIDEYPLHHLGMMFDLNPERQTRSTITHLSSSAMTFRLEEASELGPYVWTHSPAPGVSATTSLRFFDYVRVEDRLVLRPSLCYTLRFTNAIKLSTRVNLEYRRKVVGWDSEMRRILYECDHEIPCNGTEVSIPVTPTVGNPSYLLSFMEGGDRREGRHVVEHSFRFILYLSTGEKCIRISDLDYESSDEDYESDDLSFNILSKHMGNMRKSGVSWTLMVQPEFPPGCFCLDSPFYLLHKGIVTLRLPNWRKVIQEGPYDEDEDIPNVVTFKLSNVAIPYIIDFLYMGTCLPVPDRVLSEIIPFAKLGGCNWVIFHFLAESDES